MSEVLDFDNQIEAEAAAERELALNEYKANNLASRRLALFAEKVHSGGGISYTPTGFTALDEELDGGLYPGLYILGAVSSVGKTTLFLQIADQIAATGKDVLYYSLEMSADELISKSLSRLTYQNCNGETDKAKTCRGINQGAKYADYSKAELDLIDKAYEQYFPIAEHIYFFEGVGDISAKQIIDAAWKHKDLTGRAPIVFVDYLQILAPFDTHLSDKQNTDKAVLELKRLSRDLNTPVLAISSFNRGSYNGEISMSAFKESGAIEYGSDVLIGLQPPEMESGESATVKKRNSETMKAYKRAEERSVQLKILKNRNGRTEGSVSFTYYSLFNCFEEVDFNPFV